MSYAFSFNQNLKSSKDGGIYLIMKNVLKKITLLVLSMFIFSCSKDDELAQEIVKTKVKITGYRIDNFSFVAPDTFGWDGVNGLPDVYVGIFNGPTTLVHVSNVVTNVPQTGGLPLTESFVSPYYTVPSFSNTINVLVMDSDNSTLFADTDDEIGFVPFVISDYISGANKYPATVTKTANGVTATLFLTWE